MADTIPLDATQVLVHPLQLLALLSWNPDRHVLPVRKCASIRFNRDPSHVYLPPAGHRHWQVQTMRKAGGPFALRSMSRLLSDREIVDDWRMDWGVFNPQVSRYGWRIAEPKRLGYAGAVNVRQLWHVIAPCPSLPATIQQALVPGMPLSQLVELPATGHADIDEAVALLEMVQWKFATEHESFIQEGNIIIGVSATAQLPYCPSR
jgi:hypothetical protein